MTPEPRSGSKGVENGLVEFNPARAAAGGQSSQLLTLAERMAFYKVPGVSIAVIDRNRIEWAKGYGVLKAGSVVAVTPDSFFEAASTTKAVVAAIVLGLVQEGKLDLDADVNQYLKSWRVAENDFTKRQKVTLRLLLTHRAGLPATNFPYDEKGAPPTLLQVLNGEAPAGNKAAVVELLPGSKWQYSNIGYVVIQQLLEDVLAKPLAADRPGKGVHAAGHGRQHLRLPPGPGAAKKRSAAPRRAGREPERRPCTPRRWRRAG